MLTHLRSWPSGLKAVLICLIMATLLGVLQVAALLLGKLPTSLHNVVYASISMLAYLAALASAWFGRRLAFFWNALAIAVLHLVFAGWFVVSTVRLLIDLRVSPFPLSLFELWNVSMLLLALALALYLLVVERPRLLPR